MMSGSVFFLSILALPGAAAWAAVCPSISLRQPPMKAPLTTLALARASPTQTARPVPQARHAPVALLVTEDDVEAAVEKAEKLWAQALDARQRSDKLSGEAEALAEEVGGDGRHIGWPPIFRVDHLHIVAPLRGHLLTQITPLRARR